MADIQETARGYDTKNIYNMDETGFNWKAVPDTSLGISQHLGGKKKKAWITAALCYNATGTDLVPIWYIGKAACPVAFRTARIRNLEKLGAVWRYNLTIQIDYEIMIEWLKWFDARVRRPVLLLIDNFPAYKLGLWLIKEASRL